MSESKGARREELRAARRALEALPAGEIVELVGRPLLLYELRRYPRSKEGAKAARSDLPFLFKAFETGQVRGAAPPAPRPRRPAGAGSSAGAAGRAGAAAARRGDVAGGRAARGDHPRVPGLDGDRGGGQHRRGAGAARPGARAPRELLVGRAH